MANLINLSQQLVNDSQDKSNGNFLSSAFGKMIFSYRIRTNKTQKELAELANVSPKTIHRIEGGSGGIGDETYSKVFKALSISEKEIAEFLLNNQSNDQNSFIKS